jgi:hypothetical protein
MHPLARIAWVLAKHGIELAGVDIDIASELPWAGGSHRRSRIRRRAGWHHGSGGPQCRS